MSFVITARTILQLGAELISSDAVALYELIKNAIDAGSRTGVDIRFEVIMSLADYMSISEGANSKSASVDEIRRQFIEKIIHTAPMELQEKFIKLLNAEKNISGLLTAAKEGICELNRITISDNGHGMSRSDLKNIFLTIGTTNRTNPVKAAVALHTPKSPYLGEKGVGRLSVMRLGRVLRVETGTVDDQYANILDIDWNEFEEAYDKPASTIQIVPTQGYRKNRGDSFTKIIISDLRATWSKAAVEKIAKDQIARMMDPFSWDSKRRFRIKLFFNDEPIGSIRTIADELIKNAHANCKGQLAIRHDGSPELTVTFSTSLYKSQPTTFTFDLLDLKSKSGVSELGLPSSVIKTLGPFDFEFYWFNRQRIRAIPDIGDRAIVKELVNNWSGICLFRDGYRVLPYGDPGDDWLDLDRQALASPGYKLNTKQIIGRIRIGRTTNPLLLDQTNRQGLTDCNEKTVFLKLLHEVISDLWRNYLNEANNAQKRLEKTSYDSKREDDQVQELEQRAQASIKIIRRHYSGDASHLQQVKDAFLEIKDAHARAVQRIETIEEQKERLTQLAGVGLMIEVIAHELTRATEATETTLKDLRHHDLDKSTESALKLLGQQIKVIQKRLKTLEPLSITARQRRTHINIYAIVEYVLSAHSAQFLRHGIEANLKRSAIKGTQAFAIEGHIVQILENLISNSVYWMKLQKSESLSFQPVITIDVQASPPRIIYEDNGPGIPENRSDIVFEPFFSTRTGAVNRRRGLGLYIARQNAELLGGSLTLVDEGNIREGRFNTFELELKESSE